MAVKFGAERRLTNGRYSDDNIHETINALVTMVLIDGIIEIGVLTNTSS